MTERNWRDAKIPAWVKEAVEAEMEADKLRLALSWPNEPKPAPLPFRWGDYDVICGEAEPGEYYGVQAYGSHSRFCRVIIARGDDIPNADPKKFTRVPKWAFNERGFWTDSVFRGLLFKTAREAALFVLWEHCEDFAKTLLNKREALEKATQ